MNLLSTKPRFPILANPSLILLQKNLIVLYFKIIYNQITLLEFNLKFIIKNVYEELLRICQLYISSLS